jgi:hypothetical protein
MAGLSFGRDDCPLPRFAEVAYQNRKQERREKGEMHGNQLISK